MKSDQAYIWSFREWLIRQLLLTRWSAPSDFTHEELSRHLGVTVDVIEEARRRRELEIAQRGKPRHRGRKAALGLRSDHAIMRVSMPEPMRNIWHAWLRTLRVSTGALLRSLIHHFLLTGQRPVTTSRSWHYKGAVYKITIDVGKKLETKITRGAETALDHYADLWGVTATAILRGLVVDLLEGRVQKLKVIAYTELWGDPDRYLHPEKFA